MSLRTLSLIVGLCASPALAAAQDSGLVIDARIPGPYVAIPPTFVPSPRVVPAPAAPNPSPISVWRPTRPAVVVLPAPPPRRLDPVDVSVDPTAVRAELAARRQLNLARFRAYAAAGAFPDNHHQPGMLNVFIDDEGKICAAANLIAQDGLLGVVQTVARQNNFLRLGDVRSGPLYDWILSSGFTQEEIAAIQEPYAYIEPDLEEPDLMIAHDQERDRLQQRFREVEARLVRDEARSLDAAVQRLIAFRLVARTAS